MKIVVTIIFVLTNASFAQVTPEWVSTFSGSNVLWGQFVNSIAVDGSGNVYVIAVRDSGINSDKDYTTVKYSPEGVELWHQHYDGPGNGGDIPQAIAVDESGNVYVTGQSRGSGTLDDYATLKYNTDGIQQWVQRYNGLGNSNDRAKSIAVDGSGNVYVTGESDGSGTSIDYSTIKYSTDGVEQWVKRFNGTANNNDLGYRIAVDISGNVYSTGSSSSGIGQDYNFATIKYNSTGDQQWVRVFDGLASGEDNPFAITVDEAGNVYLAGESEGVGTYTDYATLKYNTNGDQLWVRYYNGTGNSSDFAASIKLDDLYNVYVTGSTFGSSDWEYATLKYDQDGNQQWIQKYNRTASSDDLAKSIAVDGSGNVYVTGGSWDSGTEYDYATIKYNFDGIEQWVHTYNSSGSLSDQATSVAVDASGYVYVTGYSGISENDFDYTTIKYSQGLHLTSPSAGDIWVSGEQDTIRWESGSAVQLLQIKLSTDGGNNYTVIGSTIPADPGFYVWDIPENLLSRKCKLLIEDVSNPNTNSVSGLFKIKAYELTRVNSNSDYERFQMFHHNWSFENGYGMWEQEYYQQFDYENGIDPYTGQKYVPDFTSWYINAKPEDFPSWPIFVRVFGASKCYVGNKPNPIMLFRWAAAKGRYVGSCYGFALSSLLAFEYKQEWINRFKVPDFTELYSVQPDTTVKRAINEVLTYNQGQEFILHLAMRLTKTPNATLEELKYALLNNELANMALIFQDIVLTPLPHILSHAVTPYKVTKDPTDSTKHIIHIYDNNEPLLDDKKIVVNTSENSWEYPDNVWGWDIGGDHGLFLSLPTLMHLVSPSRPSGSNIKDSGNDYVQVYTNSLGSTTLWDEFGNSMVYEAEDSTIINNIEGALPIIPVTGFHQPPIGYLLPPEREYRILTHKNKASVNYLSTLTNSLILFAGHSDADSTQQDWFNYSAGSIRIKNIDAVSKALNFGGIIIDDSVSQKTFDLLNLQTVQNDSLQLDVYQQDKMKLVNFESVKTYDLRLRLFSPGYVKIFEHQEVPVELNSTHFIEPDWNNFSIVMILIDIGNNGTIDDTLYIENTVDVDEKGSLLSPTNYNLAQNFPNPFNPTTTIEYSIPQAGVVTIKIYDILGREVTTLVNEEKQRGNHVVKFNASNLSSGIYFYRLHSGNFIQTKKMVLIR